MARKPRPIRIEGDIAYVPLTQGYEAVIDAADAHIVEPYTWSVFKDSTRLYAKTGIGPRNDRKFIRMHRLITQCPEGMDVDHIDHDGLNNRRSNLRECTRSQNLQNQRRRVDNTSGYKGVNYYKRTGKWRAYIMKGKKSIHLGYFDTPELAHKAYCSASEEIHGEYGFIE